MGDEVLVLDISPLDLPAYKILSRVKWVRRGWNTIEFSHDNAHWTLLTWSNALSKEFEECRVALENLKKFAVGQVWESRGWGNASVVGAADKLLEIRYSTYTGYTSPTDRHTLWDNGKALRSGEEHKMDLIKLLQDMPSLQPPGKSLAETIQEGFDQGLNHIVSDCECHKEKFGFMTHEKWCGEFVDFRTMMTRVEVVKKSDYKTKEDLLGVATEAYGVAGVQRIFAKPDLDLNEAYIGAYPP